MHPLGDKSPEEHPVSQGTRRSLQSLLPPQESVGTPRISCDCNPLTRTSLQSALPSSYGCAPFEEPGSFPHTRGASPDIPSSTPGVPLSIFSAHPAGCPGTPHPCEVSSSATASFWPSGTFPSSNIAGSLRWGGGQIVLRSARIAFPLCPPKSTILLGSIL
jgi:hypothetical protein